MLIRPLDAADAGAFQALRLRGLRECPSAFASSEAEERDLGLDLVARRLVPEAGRVVLGAFERGALVGQLGLVREHHHKLAHKAFLWGMYVAPEARGRGAARALMTAALAHARSMPGLRQVYLGVNASNVPALALYRGLGFEVFGREPGCMLVDGELHDELHMMARLVPVTAVAGGPVTRAAIRRCTSTDTPGWLEQRTALWPECSRDQHLAEMAAWLDDPERRIALVAPGDDGVAIGFAEASVRHEPVIGATTTPVGFLEGIHVAPGWRRRGVARRLVAAVEDWAVARGCRELVSDAAPDNAASHDFHRAAGFVETERCVLFSRRLEP